MGAILFRRLARRESVSAIVSFLIAALTVVFGIYLAKKFKVI